MKISTFLISGLALFSSSAFAVLGLPNAQPKVSAAEWNKVQDNTWAGIKARNIDPYTTDPGLIHRPKSEYPGDAVSEGVGYGMLLALYENDQKTFNKIWEAGNTYMWTSCHYDWHLYPDGTKHGEGGAATDAEEDIALSLIFASKLVDAGKWTSYSSSSLGSYAAHAQTILNCMWSSSEITSAGTIAPGAGWGGDSFVNPGYFSPAWYKIFADFDTNSNHDWNKVITRSYEIIQNSPGYAQGLIPDWMTPDGSYTSGMGYNSYLTGKGFYKDAIRTLWRVAIDAIWFDDENAKTYLTNALNFLNSKGGFDAANFYQIEGDSLGLLLPEADMWTQLDSGKIERTRREHSHLTIGMWATAAIAVGTDADKIAASKELAKFYDYENNANYWGLATDTSGGTEDTLHNEMYFDQFLAWFGASLMSGNFSNIADNLANPVANSKGIVYDPFVALPPIKNVSRTAMSVVRSVSGFRFEAPSNWHNVAWIALDLTGKKIKAGSGAAFEVNNNESTGIVLVCAKSKEGRTFKKVELR